MLGGGFGYCGISLSGFFNDFTDFRLVIYVPFDSGLTLEVKRSSQKKMTF